MKKTPSGMEKFFRSRGLFFIRLESIDILNSFLPLKRKRKRSQLYSLQEFSEKSIFENNFQFTELTNL